MTRPALDSLHTQVEKLAYRFWEERGRPWGSADVDWFRAETEVRRRRSESPFYYLDSTETLPLASIATEPAEQ